MDILYNKLKMIKKNPELYLGKPSMKRLGSFIFGYCDRQCEICDPCESIIDLMGSFLDFLKYHYQQPESAKNWIGIMEENNDGEKAAFDKFFELMDVYLKAKGCTEGI